MLEIFLQIHFLIKYSKRILTAHAKLYYLPKSFLVRLLNELTNNELDELARDVAKNDLVDISLFLRGGFNIASVSNIAETWLRIAQMPYRIEINGDGCKIIIVQLNII
jgi:hypothetical protein